MSDADMQAAIDSGELAATAAATIAEDRPGAASTGRSRAELIRERRAERRRNGGRELDLVVPPGDEVKVWYRPLRMKGIRSATQGKSGMAGNIDLLVTACKRIDLWDVPTGTWVPAASDTDNPEIPVRFDARLATLLDLRGATASDILVALFEGEDRAIVSAAQRLDAWSAGEDLDGAPPEEIEDLLGEAAAET